MANTKGIGASLPVVFDNAFKGHNLDGTHGLVTIKGLGGVAGNAVVFLGGATDGCYTTLQAAINALPASGGTVYILPGYTENITASIVPVADCAIICPTRDAVITDTVGTLTTGAIQAYSGTTGTDRVTIYGVNFTESGAGTTSVGVFARYAPENWRIEECTFTNFSRGIQAVLAIGANGFVDTLIKRCIFTNCINDAIFVTGFNRVLIDECRAYGGGTCDYGFSLSGLSRDVTFRKCYAMNMQYDGFRATSYWGLYGNNVFDDCVAYDNNRYGFNLYGNATAFRFPFILRTCRAELNSQHGFIFQGYNGKDCRAICTACVAVDNSYLTANGFSGFYLAATCDRIELIGCRAYKQARSEQKYGFEVVAGATKCEIRGGRWSPNQTGAWLDNGTDTILDCRDD